MRVDRSCGPVRILYIVGAGRSGSTVLDILLGSHPEVEGVGELAKLTRVFSHGAYCACGRQAAGCEFWAEVWRRWEEAVEGDPALVYPALQARYERLRQVPRMLAAAHHGTERFNAYRHLTRTLFEAVATASGARVVVDSSKSPARALALTRIPGLDLRIIHLVRDGRGVAYSYAKRFDRDLRRGLEDAIQPLPPGRVALAWLVSNLAAAGVAKAVPREHRAVVRYEDLVTRPATALEEIGRIAGIDMAPLSAAVEHGQEMPVGHAVSGNRVRMSGRLRLMADLEWRDRMPEREKTIVWRLCGGLLRHYRYQR